MLTAAATADSERLTDIPICPPDNHCPSYPFESMGGFAISEYQIITNRTGIRSSAVFADAPLWVRLPEPVAVDQRPYQDVGLRGWYTVQPLSSFPDNPRADQGSASEVIA